MKNLGLTTLVLFSVSPAVAGGDFWLTTGLHAANLLILLVVLYKLAGPKVREAMQARSDGLSKEITNAEQRFNDAEAQLAHYKDKLNALEQDAKNLLAEYRELGERERARICEEAQKDADRILSESRMLAARELENARLSIEKEVVLSALSKAEAEIKLRLTADDKQRLVSNYFVDLEAAIQTDTGSTVSQEAT